MAQINNYNIIIIPYVFDSQQWSNIMTKFVNIKGQLMKNLEQLRYLQNLFEDGILNEKEYSQ